MVQYNDIIVTINGQIGTIKFNRPKSLNSFNGKLMVETIAAIRELNEHPDTVFTVLTGEGRFFSAGADVRGSGPDSTVEYANDAEKKLAYLERFTPAMELLRSIIDHKKVFVLALNGPGVGGGAAWFTGVADIVLASSSVYLQVPFSALGLVPENGSAINFSQSMGVHRANEFLMFGRKLSVEELQRWGMVNQVFPVESFHESVREYLEEQLSVNDGKSMMETKRLQNESLRAGRMLAVVNSVSALAERLNPRSGHQRYEKENEHCNTFLSFALHTSREYKNIDSLCILQDFKDDWLAESPRMGTIYRNSMVIIAAENAQDFTAGIVGSLHANRERRVASYRQTTCSSNQLKLIGSISLGLGNIDDYKRGPLGLRGWILQEEILSPRIIHCSNARVFWRCVEGRASEMYPDISPFTSDIELYGRHNLFPPCLFPRSKTKMDDTDRKFVSSFGLDWYTDVVNEYANRQLKFAGDRLIAIAGIA
ncbi:hypothetical protein G7Y89_g5125 [Cudoniella acicularis]|uniref:Heterokaryon incompatibility domain-containing protein n=1 Tax=Cudoniella acicularis TaxID=354080 RepID=A0A8H4W429_9HELO|nr:hypothetical protein G7Y89_g5125 [Cudoniella acicularis]